MGKISESEFTAIYEENKQYIFNVAYSFVHDVGEAEDLVSEAFLAFLKYRPEHKDPVRTRSWLIKTTMNKARSNLRKKKPSSLEFPEENGGEDQNDETFDAVCRLPKKYQEILLLFYYGGMNLRECAKSLHTSPGAAEKRLERAKAILKENLEEKS